MMNTLQCKRSLLRKAREHKAPLQKDEKWGEKEVESLSLFTQTILSHAMFELQFTLGAYWYK